MPRPVSAAELHDPVDVALLRRARNKAALEAGRLLDPARGYGPLLQRDYWAVIRGCRFTPSEVVDLVASRFWEFSPEQMAAFRRTDGSHAPIREGDVLQVRIRLAGRCHVRVIHRDRCSFTLATLEGHPESGRITFGAYRNERGDVIFHIRSRARTSSGHLYAGFLALGEAMQTFTWSDFVNCVALTAGDGVIGFIHADTLRIEDEAPEALKGPTFIAEGD